MKNSITTRVISQDTDAFRDRYYCLQKKAMGLFYIQNTVFFLQQFFELI